MVRFVHLYDINSLTFARRKFKLTNRTKRQLDGFFVKITIKPEILRKIILFEVTLRLTPIKSKIIIELLKINWFSTAEPDVNLWEHFHLYIVPPRKQRSAWYRFFFAAGVKRKILLTVANWEKKLFSAMFKNH